MSSKKAKKTVWHKKRERIIPSKFMKEQHPDKSEKQEKTKDTDKIKRFVKNFDEQIRKAVYEKHET